MWHWRFCRFVLERLRFLFLSKIKDAWVAGMTALALGFICNACDSFLDMENELSFDGVS